jgi:hypothetical protein
MGADTKKIIREKERREGAFGCLFVVPKKRLFTSGN